MLRRMSQVSPPVRIALLVAVLFIGVWFVALRPKSSTTSSPATPPAPAAGSGFKKAVDKATAAKDNSNAAAAKQEATANAVGAGGTAAPAQTTPGRAPAATPATPAKHAAARHHRAVAKRAPAAKPAPAPTQTAGAPTVVANTGAAQAGALVVAPRPVDHGGVSTSTQPVAALPADMRAAIDHHKVIVLLFWQNRSPEDRAVHSAVAGLSRHGGAVKVKIAPIGAVGRYSKITAGVDVLQSPTVIVVDRKRHARTFVGFVDQANIEQAVLGALR
jgi:hypothetical protein